jgi:hypothetical protein
LNFGDLYGIYVDIKIYLGFEREAICVKIAICDDEKVFRRTLISYLEKYARKREMVMITRASP